jgi:hypothetical protein
VILLSDVKVADADRTPARLAERAAAGELKAVRVLWLEGYDTVFAVPYHAGLPHSGQRPHERPTLNMDRYDGKRFEGSVESKMLGQEWIFQATVKADLERGGVAEIEPAAVVEDAGTRRIVEATDDTTRMKLALGELGYAFNEDMFRHAVVRANLQAVELFLDLGVPPNTEFSSGHHAMILAVSACSRDPQKAVAVVSALLAASGDVNATGAGGVTPIIEAAQQCDAAMVELLVASGADVNAQSTHGATALIMATAMGKQDVVDILRAAGATE